MNDLRDRITAAVMQSLLDQSKGRTGILAAGTGRDASTLSSRSSAHQWKGRSSSGIPQWAGFHSLFTLQSPVIRSRVRSSALTVHAPSMTRRSSPTRSFGHAEMLGGAPAATAASNATGRINNGTLQRMAAANVRRACYSRGKCWATTCAQKQNARTSTGRAFVVGEGDQSGREPRAARPSDNQIPTAHHHPRRAPPHHRPPQTTMRNLRRRHRLHPALPAPRLLRRRPHPPKSQRWSRRHRQQAGRAQPVQPGQERQDRRRPHHAAHIRHHPDLVNYSRPHA